MFQYFVFVLLAGIILATFLPHLFIHTASPIDKKNIIACKAIGQTHSVIITNSGFNPQILKAQACDKVIFINRGNVYHQVAFGDHPTHLIYPGFNERAMPVGDKNEVILTALGTYKIHDHIYEELEGSLIISK